MIRVGAIIRCVFFNHLDGYSLDASFGQQLAATQRLTATRMKSLCLFSSAVTRVLNVNREAVLPLPCIPRSLLSSRVSCIGCRRDFYRYPCFLHGQSPFRGFYMVRKPLLPGYKNPSAGTPTISLLSLLRQTRIAMSFARITVDVTQLILNQWATAPPHKAPQEGRFKTTGEIIFSLAPVIFWVSIKRASRFFIANVAHR